MGKTFMDLDPYLPRRIFAELSGLNLCMFEKEWRARIDEVIASVTDVRNGGQMRDLSDVVAMLEWWEEVAGL